MNIPVISGLLPQGLTRAWGSAEPALQDLPYHSLQPGEARTVPQDELSADANGSPGTKGTRLQRRLRRSTSCR